MLVLVDVDLAIVIQDVEADRDDDIKMLWLEHQEILVLILEYKLA